MALPDISLAQFNRIASGSYNAGQIDIQVGKDGKAELVKINNHVWSKSKECPWGLTPWTLWRRQLGQRASCALPQRGDRNRFLSGGKDVRLTTYDVRRAPYYQTFRTGMPAAASSSLI